MKIAIHYKDNDFSSKWIAYCKEHRISYKIVCCYDNDIIDQLADCDALMWHFHHADPKDFLFAKQLLYSLQTAGKVVFPNFSTAWHFDDKVGQKYLLEAVGAPLAPSYVFYDKSDALDWIAETNFPKVFKLRRGSGSNHVKLAENKKAAEKFVKKAFGRGFKQYDVISNLRERWRKFRAGKATFKDLLKGAIRLGYTTEFSKVAGSENGYIYFQDFIPGNKYDMRIHIVSNRCFGCIRYTRPNDFRASGSNIISYDFEKIPKVVIKKAFEIAKKLELQSVAFDFIMYNKKPLIVEMSYAFGVDPDDFKYGYWNSKLDFVETEFNPYGWMVESVIEEATHKTTEVA